MKYIMDAAKMKAVDECSIKKLGIPSLVLMERAALGVSQYIATMFGDLKDTKALCVCGTGNNGADGLAVARQLFENGADVCVLLTSDRQGTKEYELQKDIVNKLGIECVIYEDSFDFSEYNCIVDAIFGIGLSRTVEGKYRDIIDNINATKDSHIVSIDIPSGVSATTGEILGVAVHAEVSITFGYNKVGMVIYPGAGFCGRIIVHNAGFATKEFLTGEVEGFNSIFTYEDEDLALLPSRRSDSNKGTYGKSLIIAGSKSIGGAAVLSGKAAYCCGTGLVKLITHKENKSAILNAVPECLLYTYEDTFDEREVGTSMDWAGCTVVGPGLSTDDNARALVKLVLNRTDVKRVLDADALNIIAEDNLKLKGEYNIIVTPHIMEMSRLTGIKVADIKADSIGVAKTFAKDNRCICVLKDARTIVTDGDRVFINTSGNDGMSTGGSGDVLTGIISSLIVGGMDMFEAAALGVYIHGKAGDIAAEKLGKRVMMAGNIAECLSEVFEK